MSFLRRSQNISKIGLHVEVILHKATSITTEKQNFVFIVCKLGKSSFESNKAEVKNGIAVFSNSSFSSVIHLEKGSKGIEEKHLTLKIKELKDEGKHEKKGSTLGELHVNVAELFLRLETSESKSFPETSVIPPKKSSKRGSVNDQNNLHLQYTVKLTRDYDEKSAQTSSTAKTRSQTLGGSSRDLLGNSSKENKELQHDDNHKHSHNNESDRPQTPSKPDGKSRLLHSHNQHSSSSLGSSKPELQSSTDSVFRSSSDSNGSGKTTPSILTTTQQQNQHHSHSHPADHQHNHDTDDECLSDEEETVTSSTNPNSLTTSKRRMLSNAIPSSPRIIREQSHSHSLSSTPNSSSISTTPSNSVPISNKPAVDGYLSVSLDSNEANSPRRWLLRRSSQSGEPDPNNSTTNNNSNNGNINNNSASPSIVIQTPPTTPQISSSDQHSSTSTKNQETPTPNQEDSHQHNHTHSEQSTMPAATETMNQLRESMKKTVGFVPNHRRTRSENVNQRLTALIAQHSAENRSQANSPEPKAISPTIPVSVSYKSPSLTTSQSNVQSSTNTTTSTNVNEIQETKTPSGSIGSRDPYHESESGKQPPMLSHLARNEEANRPRLNSLLSSKSMDTLGAKEERRMMEAQGFVLEHFIKTTQLSFSHEVSLSAHLIFRCVIETHSFQNRSSTMVSLQEESFHQRVLDAMTEQIEDKKNDVLEMQFWLSCTSQLIFMCEDRKNQLLERRHVTRTDFFFAFCSSLRSLLQIVFGHLINLLYNSLDGHCKAIMSGDKKENEHVNNICSELNKCLQSMKKFHTFSLLRISVFRQIYFRLNEKFLNALLKQKELCTLGTALKLKMAIVQLENWLDALGDQSIAQQVRKEVSAIRQTADMLMMPKQALLDDKIRKDVCASLSVRQIHRLLENYTPDEYDPEKVPSDVLKGFENLAREEAKISKPDGTSSTLSMSGVSMNPEYRFPLNFEISAMKKNEAETLWDSSNLMDIPPDILCKDSFAFLKQPLNDLFI